MTITHCARVHFVASSVQTQEDTLDHEEKTMRFYSIDYK